MASPWSKRDRNAQYTLANDEECSYDEIDSPSPKSGGLSGYYVSLLWQFLCVCMFLYGLKVQWLQGGGPISVGHCTRETSLWSPISDSVEYEVRNFTASITLEGGPYDGPPTPERERLWKILESMPPVLIPKASVPLLYRSTNANLLRSGDESAEGYIGTIEVFHHLHCLNAIRQHVWQDQYPEDMMPSFLTHKEPRAHVSHCISVLRQALMCTADLTPYLWYEGHGEPAKEDFEAAHKCKKFDSIVSAVLEHSTRFPDGAFGS